MKPVLPDDDLSNVIFEPDTVIVSLGYLDSNVPISATKPLSHVANMDVYTGAGVVVVVVVVVGAGVVVVVTYDPFDQYASLGEDQRIYEKC